MNRGVSLSRRALLLGVASIAASTSLSAPLWAVESAKSDQILAQWYKLLLELIRHTATYSPPVAARSFAYVGITAYEAVASVTPTLRSLAGQVNGLTTLPARGEGAFDGPCILQSALVHAMQAHFGNTGPTGQRAMQAMTARLDILAATDVDPEVMTRSAAYGLELATHILDWSKTDGGAEIINLGFPLSYDLVAGPEHWVPTSLVALQQAPLLPDWGNVRTFTFPANDACELPPPPAYSEDPGSDFYIEALEVYETGKNLTPEQRAIARFWSDDPMLSPTPPGHWVSIALQVFEANAVPLERQVETLALVGMAISDGFVACWRSKYKYNLLRPITYIRRVIDPKWEPTLNTPPFPEYPSGHSSQTAAASGVLAALFGQEFAFTDGTHFADGLPERNFASFNVAAEEAGISRLYGGIHFRSAIEQGLLQGQCVAQYVLKVNTRA